MLSAGLDANILISAIAFGGKPMKVLERALAREFLVVMSPQIFQEVHKNLTGKLGVHSATVTGFIYTLSEIASILVPSGKMKVTGYAPDDLVIETALMGGSDVLVTGDKKHLLPLGSVSGMLIEPPSKFLARFE